MPFEIRIKGADELIRRFTTGDAAAEGFLTRAMQGAVDHVHDNAKTYPPESEANAPPPPYYIRGVGTQYRFHNRRESRQLGDNWRKLIVLEDNGVVGTVSNEVPYAPYVHGNEFQAGFHAARGWRTVNAIGEAVRDTVQEFFTIAARLYAKALRGG